MDVLQGLKVYKNHLILALLLVSLGTRVVMRGEYIPGWDLIGPAYGTYMLSEHDFWYAITDFFKGTRYFQYWNHTNSVIFTTIPGVLNQFLPSLYWSHLMIFGMWLVTLFAIVKALKPPPSLYWIVGLCWLASPTLQSFSVFGYPNILGAMPYILCLALLFSNFVRSQPLMVLVALALVTELSWHIYESGKMVWWLLLVTPFFLRHVPFWFKLGCVVLAAIQVWQLIEFPGANIHNLYKALEPNSDSALVNERQGFDAGELAMIQLITKGHIWVPFLFIAATAALALITENRLIALVLYGFAGATLASLTILDLVEIRGRRTLNSDTIYVMLILWGCRDYIRAIAAEKSIPLRQFLFRSLFVVLGVGVAFQFAQLAFYAAQDREQRVAFLPGAFSWVDFKPYKEGIDVATWIIDRVESGDQVLWVYNYSAYPENRTDPAGLLERVYLAIGHEKFLAKVRVFGSQKERYSKVPIFDAEPYKIAKELSRWGGHQGGEYWLVTYDHSRPDSVFHQERQKILGALHQTFAVKPNDLHPLPSGAFASHRLEARPR